MSGYRFTCILLDQLSTSTRHVADPLALGISFLVAFIIGIIIGIIIIICCGKRIYKRVMAPDEEKGFKKRRLSGSSASFGSSSSSCSSLSSLSNPKKRPHLEFHDVDHPTILTVLGLDKPGQRSGDSEKSLTHALLKKKDTAGDLDIMDQDLASSIQLETDLRWHRLVTFGQLVRIQFNRAYREGDIDADTLHTLQKNADEGLKELKQRYKFEMKSDMAEFDKDKSLKKKPLLKLQKRLELQSKANTLLRSLIGEERSRIRSTLSWTGKLSDQDADDLMSRLAADMTNYEQKMAELQARQVLALEERLGRRQQLLSSLRQPAEDLHAEVGARTEHRRTQLSQIPDVSEKQLKAIMEKYRQELLQLEKSQEKNVSKQQQDLAHSLRSHRAHKQLDLCATHLTAQQKMHSRADKMADTEDFLWQTLQVLDQQTADKETLVNDLDQQEGEKLEHILLRTPGVHLTPAEDTFIEQLTKAVPSLTGMESERLMALHEQQMNEWKRAKRHERRGQLGKLQERLAERRSRLEERQRQAMIEEKVLKEEQDGTLEKTLTLLMEMPDDARDRIMREHQANMLALSNQLQLSRTRQHKVIERQLAERRAKIDEIQRQKTEATDAQRGEPTKDSKKDQEKLDKNLEEENKRMEEDHARALSIMKESLAIETQGALAMQEKQIAGLIGRLQAGQARRQEVISKQERILSELEAQMEERVAQRGDQMSMSGLDQLMQSHRNQVNSLRGQQEAARRNQEQMLAERLHKERRRKERVVGSQLEEEKSETKWQMERMGMGRSGQALLEGLLDSRQTQAMSELEQEFSAELQKQRDQMYRQMEKELEEALGEQRKTFIANLASVSKLNQEDIDTVVAAAAQESGLDDKSSRALSRDFRNVMRRADAFMIGPGYSDDEFNEKRHKKKSRDRWDSPELRRDRPRGSDDDDKEVSPKRHKKRSLKRLKKKKREEEEQEGVLNKAADFEDDFH